MAETTTRKLRAYKNDPVLREAFIAEMDWHRDQDKIIAGKYREGTNGDFRGCFIGCAVHSLAKLRNEPLNTSEHQLLETLLDIPVELAHLADAIFESLTSDKRVQFAVDLPRAIQAGADLGMIIPHFLYWALTDDVKPTRYPQFQPFIDAVVALYEEWTRTGVRPSASADLADRADRAYLAYLASRSSLADLAYRADRADLYRADLASRSSEKL